jgi:hypothetical protein
MAAAFFTFFSFAQCQKMPWGTLGKLPDGFPGGDRQQKEKQQ